LRLNYFCWSLPAIVNKSPVRFSHPVKVFTSPHGDTAAARGFEQFGVQPVGNWPTRSFACCGNEPPLGQSAPAFRANFHRYLVSCSTHSAGLDFQCRHYVPHGLLENLKAGPVGFFFEHSEGVVHSALSHRLFTTDHKSVDKAGEFHAPVLWVRGYVSALCAAPA